MYPTPWTTSVPPPAATKPTVNSYENNMQSFPFFGANAMQNISMNQSLQPNAIDPAMVQKWQEWKRWEAWQQQFQQWQQQTGQMTSATSQPAPPPMPPSQSLQPSHPPPISFQNQQYSYHQPGPPLPVTNQSQQNTTNNEVGLKRGLESEFQSEKKMKIDTGNNKKEIELNDETEVLFEEQFKSWEEQFLKWKEENKNHPDRVQYLEYEKKWINWRDNLKQKCEVLKKKRELKLVEKRKEAIQVEENKLQTQQRLSYNPMMPNDSNLTNEPPLGPPPPPSLQQSHNNMMTHSNSENQIPGLDLVSNNENSTKGFLNVSRILPQNQIRPIQTPDDKPFNFPKSIMNPSTLNSDPINMPYNKMNQPPMYQNASNWSKYNNPVSYHNQFPPDVNNTSISSFGKKTDIDSRLQCDGNMPNLNYNGSQNAPNMNYRRPILEGSYNKSSSEASKLYNKSPDEQSYNRNFNTSSSSDFRGYSQTKGNVSDFNNFSRQSENSNTPYQQSNPCLNTASSKPPSLLSLNLIKPISLDNPENYLETQNSAPDRYKRNWNIVDEEDDPENEYMEAHKKFSSEPFDDQNDEDEQFSNKQHSNMYNENHYSRELSGARHFNDDYIRPSSQLRESQILRNTDNKYVRPNSQFSRNINQGYTQEMPTLKNNEDDFFNSQKNIRNTDKRFSMETPLLNDNDEEHSNEPIIPKNNFVSQKSNYELNKSGPPSRENYESSRDRPPLIGNYDSSRGGGPPSIENYESFRNEPSLRGNYDSFRGRPSSRGNYESFRGGLSSREHHTSSRGGPFSRGNYNSFRDGPPSRGNFGNNTNKANMEWEWDENYTKNEKPIEDPVVSLPTTKQIYEEAQPIDPVKIFDYRHLPTLKVIPGLSKETVVPIRIYDYKHGGKRILPWQDRGYSRRSSNHTRDLIEQEDFIQENTDDGLNKNKDTIVMNPTVSLNDISSDKIKPNIDNKKTDEITKESPITIDTITILDDEDEDVKEVEPVIELQPEPVTELQPEPVIEIIDICAPSPPRVSEINEVEKSSNRQLLTIETLLCPPGRPNRPSKIVIILRGLPGSGKSHVAKLIKEKEVAMGGQAPRILSLDDYFMTEVTKMEIDPETNKKVERKVMEYEHDPANENLYRISFIKAFKKKILENYFSFYIIDAINNKVSYYKEIIDISRMNGFTVFIIELETDIDLCIKRNIHNRTAHDINSIMRSWVKTPSDQILLDIRSLLFSPSENEMEMEDVSDVEMEVDKDEEANDDRSSEENRNIEFEEEDVMKLLSCKWTDTIPQEEKMKRLDGLCKKKPESSIKEWLQIPEDNYSVSEQVVLNDGKKRVRWADMEERREQEKMRAIGFVVGQTDWNRMLGRDQGESKLTQTKYI